MASKCPGCLKVTYTALVLFYKIIYGYAWSKQTSMTLFGSSDFYALPRQFKFLFRHCTMHCYVKTKATDNNFGIYYRTVIVFLKSLNSQL